jgi:cell division protein FtsZ
VLRNAVGGISDIIHIPGLVNVDFEDVKTVMSEPGKAMMGTGMGTGPDRAKKAAEAAVACPLLEGIDLSNARGVLVLIAASKGTFKLAESRNAMNAIRHHAAEDAHVIYGTAYDESLGDQLRVTVIATGLSGARGSAARTDPRGAPRAEPRAAGLSPLSVVQQQQPQHPGQHAHHQQLRTGTDGLPILTHAHPGASGLYGGSGPNAALQPGLHAPQHNYDGMQTPSVWRRPRSEQAAAKVEALVNNGVDEIEIPAFLRKQAD